MKPEVLAALAAGVVFSSPAQRSRVTKNEEIAARRAMSKADRAKKRRRKLAEQSRRRNR